MMTAVLKERLQRVLGRLKRTFESSTVLKLAVLAGVLRPLARSLTLAGGRPVREPAGQLLCDRSPTSRKYAGTGLLQVLYSRICRMPAVTSA
jgi:hypothetical protein